ncbi:MAG: DUF4199 domain-containing protein [Bacteroidota bacterium]
MQYIKPLFRVAFKYAITASVLAIALILILFYSGKHPLLIPIAYDFRILLFGVFIYFSIREFKAYHNSGELHFWQGLLIGIFFYLLVGAVVGCVIGLFANVEPDFLSEYIQSNVQGLEMNKAELTAEGPVTLSEAEFDHQLELTKATGPVTLAVDYFIKSCVLGFFISILLGVILRKTESRK